MIKYFFSPKTAAEAVEIRTANRNCIYVAGSTDVSVKLYKDGLSCDGFIDISKLKALRGICPEEYKIGAITTFTDILYFNGDTPELRLLKAMAGQVAAMQIRNRGTLGGNISNASPAADSLPVLSVLNAAVIVLDSNGEHRMPLEDYLNMCKKGDSSALLCSIEYEKLPEAARYGFVKVGRRESLAISRLNGCAAITVDEGKITWARLSIGAVSPVTGRFMATEKAIIGRPYNEDTLLLAGREAEKEAEKYIGKRASAAYKLPVIKELVPELLCSCMKESE